MRVLVLLLLSACSVAEIPGTGEIPASATPQKKKSDTATTNDKKSGPTTNTDRPEQVACETSDWRKLDSCACEDGGRARCVAKSKLPENLTSELDSCDGDEGACVPDTMLESRGKLTSCKWSGQEGRCVNLCVPKVARYAGLLTRGDDGECANDERCVPCTMPDGTRSGICDVEVPDAPSCN